MATLRAVEPEYMRNRLFALCVLLACVGAVALWSFDKSRPSQLHEVSSTTAEETTVLDEDEAFVPSQVSGVVLLPDGGPAGGATVRWVEGIGRHDGCPVCEQAADFCIEPSALLAEQTRVAASPPLAAAWRSSLTDEAGLFLLDLADAGVGALYIVSADNRYTAVAYPSGETEGEPEVTVQMSGPRPVSFRAHDDDTQVTIDVRLTHEITGTTRSFHLASADDSVWLEPGGWAVAVTAPGRPPRAAYLFVSNDPDRTTDMVALPLAATHSVTIVTLSEGLPIDAAVTLRSSKNNAAHQVLGRTFGQPLVMHWPQSEVTIQATTAELASDSVTLHLTPLNNHVTLDLRPKGGRLRVSLVGLDGQPIEASTLVTVTGLSDYESQTGSTLDRFEFSQLPVGQYEIEASTTGFFTAKQEVNLGTDTIEVDLPIRRSRTIVGMVVAPDGTPIDAAWVKGVSLSGQQEASVVTDETGVFRLDGFAEAEAVQVFATHGDWGRADATAQGLDRLELTLRPSASVEYLVTDAQGTPVAGATVDVVSTTSRQAVSGQTDGHGRYELKTLFEGTPFVGTVRSVGFEDTSFEGHAPTSIHVTLPQLATLEVLYQGPADATLFCDKTSCQVVDRDGGTFWVDLPTHRATEVYALSSQGKESKRVIAKPPFSRISIHLPLPARVLGTVLDHTGRPPEALWVNGERTPVDPIGRFEVLAEGSSLLVATDEASLSVDIPDGGGQLGVVRLPPPCLIQGRVIEPDGRAASGARVSHDDESTTSGVGGHFRLRCDSKQRERVEVTARRGHAIGAAVGRQGARLEIRLQAAPVLEGIVVDAAGKGVATHVQCDSRQVHTGTDGRFRLELEPGSGTCSAPGYLPHQYVLPASGASITMTIGACELEVLGEGIESVTLVSSGEAPTELQHGGIELVRSPSSGNFAGRVPCGPAQLALCGYSCWAETVLVARSTRHVPRVPHP
jgi:hypothetical protein